MIKKILIGFGIFFVVMMVIGLIAGEDATQSPAASTVDSTAAQSATPQPAENPAKTQQKTSDDGILTDKKREEIVKYFKSDQEPSVEDAVFTSDSILSLGMLDDGSNRDGFAEYACQVLISDFDVKEDVYVKIIDIAKLVRTDKWIKMGEHYCNQ